MIEYNNNYRKWRWAIYNNICEDTLVSFISNIKMKHISIGDGNLYYVNYNQELIDKYNNNDFNVGIDQISEYDKNMKNKIFNKIKESNDFFVGNINCLKSNFIENCNLSSYVNNESKLVANIKKNIINYYWWDEFDMNLLSESIINNFYLKSTIKLIGKDKLIDCLKKEYTSSNILIDFILENISFRKSALNMMFESWRRRLNFDYNFLFNVDLLKSIRIVENNCRKECKIKSIGSFYNEDLLLKSLIDHYGDVYRIISQGSPEWLSPQRFDIYFPDLNLAIEYQGEQHIKPVDFGGKGKKVAKKQFKNNIKRDETKKTKSDINNCSIIYVYPGYNLEKVIQDIDQFIKIYENKIG